MGWSRNAYKESPLQLRAEGKQEASHATRKQGSELVLRRWFSVQATLLHRGSFGNVWRQIWLAQLESGVARASSAGEAMDAVTHPTMHRTHGHKELSARNVNRAQRNLVPGQGGRRPGAGAGASLSKLAWRAGRG